MLLSVDILSNIQDIINWVRYYYRFLILIVFFCKTLIFSMYSTKIFVIFCQYIFY